MILRSLRQCSMEPTQLPGAFAKKAQIVQKSETDSCICKWQRQVHPPIRMLEAFLDFAYESIFEKTKLLDDHFNKLRWLDNEVGIFPYVLRLIPYA